VHNLERDLGVLVTDNLSVSTQCAEAAKKAMKVRSMVRRHFKDMDKECFTILYKSFVRPRLEYAIQAWSPYLRRDIDCLGKIQCRATKLVKGMKNLSYEQRLCNLGLPTLAARRLRGDFIETYKIVTGKANIKIEDFLEFGVTGYSLRGLLDNSRTGQLADSQVADKPTRGRVNSQTVQVAHKTTRTQVNSHTSQLAENYR